MSTELNIHDIQFVKELYPRLREDDAAIERYRASLDLLPPITVARGRVLVDGFHRWQAHRREGAETVQVDDLGNLTDVEIVKESVRRNSSHGRQLETKDKRRMADLLWRQGTRDEDELCALLSVTAKTCAEYLRDAKRDEKAEQKAKAWDLWLNCRSYRDIAAAIDGDDATVGRWVDSFSNELGNEPPESRQHFDVWSFQTSTGDSSYFGAMPPQVVENVLWLWTEPGQIVVDPFAGGGTTIDVAKAMGRRIWASDRNPSTPTLPIHEHDIAAAGWPADAPRKADLILLDPPYWQQAKGKYSDAPDDLGNMTLDDFMAAWDRVVKACTEHLAENGRVAFIVSPSVDVDRVIDHAFDMRDVCTDHGLTTERRVIVTYNTQQATGQQVTWARENRQLLKLYRDLVVMR